MKSDLEVVRNALGHLAETMARFTSAPELSRILAIAPAAIVGSLIVDSHQLLGMDPASATTAQRLEILARSQNDVTTAETLEGRLDAVAAASVHNYFGTKQEAVRPGSRSRINSGLTPKPV